MCKVRVYSSYSSRLLVIVEVPAYFSAVRPYGFGLQRVSSRDLFHEATSPVMAGENTSHNGNNNWSLFHKTISDKRPRPSKLQQSDGHIRAI